MALFNFFRQSKIISINKFFTNRVMRNVNVFVYQFIQITKIRFTIISWHFFTGFTLQCFYKPLSNYWFTFIMSNLILQHRVVKNSLPSSTHNISGLRLDSFTFSIKPWRTVWTFYPLKVFPKHICWKHLCNLGSVH